MNKSELLQKNTVTVGGGTGHFVLIDGLKEDIDPEKITAIPPVSDDGGDSGNKIVEFGVLPPGDARQCMVALAPNHRQLSLSQLMNFRFEEGISHQDRLIGDNMGNLTLAVYEMLHGNQEAALAEAMLAFAIPGKVIPVSHKRGTLLAELFKSGKIIKGETNIDLRAKNKDYDPEDRIKRIFLEKPIYLNPNARRALQEAELIVFAPGDLYTSVLPHFLVEGFTDTLRHTKAKIFFCLNLMTKPGETDGFEAHNIIEEVIHYSGNPRFRINYVLINNNHIPQELVKTYEDEGQFQIKGTEEDKRKIKKLLPETEVIIKDLVTAVEQRKLIRHDPEKLAKTIINYLK